jgi:hypothetical protein
VSDNGHDGERPEYEPPTQSLRGQLVDSVIILVLLFAVLFGVTYYTESSSSSSAGEPKPLAQLPISDTERRQYQKLIDAEVTDVAGVNDQVANNRPRDDKYTFGIGELILTFGVIGGYLTFVYVMSFREYREVIRERFGPPVDRVGASGTGAGS